VKDDSTFLGRVKVKVGPVTAAYNGKVTITNRDDGAHVVSMVGEGREAAGSGSAKMTMTSRLASLPTGVTQVRVTADVDIVGKAAQFGRGMIETVNKQLFKQFTECVRTTLEPPADHSPRSATNDLVSPSTSMSSSGSAAPPGSSRSQAEPLRLVPMLLRAAMVMLGRWVGAARQRLRRQRDRGVV
jgi:carbon monoxide dehydrogenase subunit G